MLAFYLFIDIGYIYDVLMIAFLADWKTWVEILMEDGWALKTSTHTIDRGVHYRTCVFSKTA